MTQRAISGLVIFSREKKIQKIIKTAAGQKYGLRETASRKRRFEAEEQSVESVSETDISIKTQQRRVGSRLERTTKVNFKFKTEKNVV